MMKHIFFSKNFSQTNNDDSVLRKDLHKTLRPIILMGLILCFLAITGFGIWGSFAPLDSAVIANGSIILQHNRKTIQHLEGGIITHLYVKEGQHVQAGQALLHLNNTHAQARKALLTQQLLAAKATEARLEAEREGKEKVTFPETLLATKNQELSKILSSQRALFDTDRKSLDEQITILEQKISQLRHQIKGLSAQKTATQQQQDIIIKEINIVSPLLQEGLVTESRMLQLTARSIELDGKQAEYQSAIALAYESITETELQILHIQTERLKEITDELKETQQIIANLHEELSAAEDVLQRTVIYAPQSGKVTGLQFHTIGGVISPAAPIMDIVPQNDPLIVEARVLPQDIELVRIGLPTKVMLSAYKSRFVPRIAGEVTYVSADRFSDPQNGTSYYLIRVRVYHRALARLNTTVKLYPGMPAEVFINTGTSTFLEYLLSPILDAFRRSFREA